MAQVEALASAKCTSAKIKRVTKGSAGQGELRVKPGILATYWAGSTGLTEAEATKGMSSVPALRKISKKVVTESFINGPSPKLGQRLGQCQPKVSASLPFPVPPEVLECQSRRENLGKACQERESSATRSFWDGYPADIQASFGRASMA